MIDNDDLPVGRVLTRREVLAAFGVSAGVLLAGCAGARSGGATATTVTAGTTAPGNTGATAAKPSVAAAQVAAAGTAGTASGATGCVVRPEMTEGPYFVDEKLNRSDIRTDPTDGTAKPGVPLALTFAVAQAGTNACTPLAGATVDVWHCDAQGVYSDVTDSAIGFNTVGKKFLRGSQVTDARGAATFTTIYPGWYQGRAVHIHFKIRTTAPGNQAYEFTSQLFFDDALNDQIFANAPYTKAGKRTTNASDGIYRNGGDQMLLAPTKSDQGYAATFAVALDLSDTNVGKPDGNGANGGGPGSPGGGPPGGARPGGPGGPPPGGRATTTPTG